MTKNPYMETVMQLELKPLLDSQVWDNPFQVLPNTWFDIV